MIDTDGGCAYVLDPETWDGDGAETCYVSDEVLNDDGVWMCPHDTSEEEKFCVFHRPLDAKAEGEALDALLDVMDAEYGSETERNRAQQFVNATFWSLAPGDRRTERVIGDLDLSHAEVSGDVDWGDTVFEGDVRFAGTVIGDDASFHETVFESATTFRGASFAGDAVFSKTRFGGHALFTGAEFGERALFAMAAFPEGASFYKTVFGGVAKFESAEFDGYGNFRDAMFESTARFRRATFADDARFRGVTFAGKCDFTRTTFERDTTFTRIEFGALRFDGATFVGGVQFGWDAPGDAKFRDAVFDGDADFEDVSLPGANFAGADLTDASFVDATLHDATFERALLSRATLFGADLRGAKLAGAVLGDVRVDEDTAFLGQPATGRSEYTLTAVRSRPLCVYDPDYGDGEGDIDKAKSYYRALEELGRRHALPRLQSRCFVRRQDLQRRGYWERATSEGESAEETLVAGARWCRASVARATLLYGESPWRAVGYSAITIFGFALIYPLGGWVQPVGGDPITYASLAADPSLLAGLIYYSTLVFTAFGFGGFEPVGVGRVLTTVETVSGALLLALLVFILGRRAAR